MSRAVVMKKHMYMFDSRKHRYNANGSIVLNLTRNISQVLLDLLELYPQIKVSKIWNTS